MWWHLKYSHFVWKHENINSQNHKVISRSRQFIPHFLNRKPLSLRQLWLCRSHVLQLKLTFAQLSTFSFLVSIKTAFEQRLVVRWCLALLIMVSGTKQQLIVKGVLSTRVFSVFSVLWHSSKQKHCRWDYCENLPLAHSPLVCAVLTGLKKGAAG